MTDRLWRLAPTAAALLTVAVYFILDPKISDLPAAEFRTWLFEHEGFTLWNNQWYAGHHTPGYSVLFPPLSAWLGGPEVIGAIYTVAAAALFEPLLRHHFGAKTARWPAIAFGFGVGTLLFSSRLPWGLGATFAIASALALQRNRPYLATALAVAATLSSPVAGAFLAMAVVAWVLADRESRLRDGALVAAGGLVPPMILTFAFPEGGNHPFVFGSFFIVPLVALGFAWLLPSHERTLRIAAVLYALAAIGAFIVPTPFGGNAVRLGQLFGVALALAAAIAIKPTGARRLGWAVLIGALVWWQWAPIVREARKVKDDPSTEAGYYAPLTDFLKTQRGPMRVEVPTLRSQWHTYYVAKEVPLARGWLRQLDIKLNDLFYEDGKLTPDSYRRWLAENAVRFVALPDSKLDYSGEDEGALIRRGLPYLRQVHASAHWRVYEVTPRPALVAREANTDIAVTKISPDSVELNVIRPGPAILKVHFSPYWRLEGGCVERAGEWTRIEPKRAGRTTLVTTFAPARVLDRGTRCS